MTSIAMHGHVAAVVLAGGRGSRMGGVDKGLQTYRGQALALHALQRLQAQTGGAPGKVAINANRNLDTYAQWGYAVWPDGLADYAGPLAGFLTALVHCHQQTPPPEWLLTVPCDSPLFPLDLLQRMLEAVTQSGCDAAVASAPEPDDAGHVRTRTQPVFCLMRTRLLDSLQTFTSNGGRKIDAWTGQHHAALVPFDQPGDDPKAFFNANTLDQLRQLEQQ
jgi:molybdopterin-guanine dinucleotide biosynthesis protein A